MFYLVIKLTKPFAVRIACTSWKTKSGIGIICFVLIISLMLPKIFIETLTSISNKHNRKTFTESLQHLCYIALKTFWTIHPESAMMLWQWLLWVSPSQLKPCQVNSSLGTMFIHWYLLDNSVIISSKKDYTDTPLSFLSRTS